MFVAHLPLRAGPFAALVAALGALALAAPATALDQRIESPNEDLFGIDVAQSGNTLVVGAPEDNDSTGAVYVYARSGDRWTRTSKLTASDGAPGDILGQSVAIDGDTIVAGAGGNATNTGAVYTFSRTGAPARTETAKLTASDGAEQAKLGQSVAIDGDTIVAGAPFADIGNNRIQGAVYTFAATGAAARNETAKLTASDGAFGALLGYAVAIDGDAIVAGAPFFVADKKAIGAIYTFARTGDPARNETAELTSSDPQEQSLLGVAVAVNSDTIVAGAPATQVAGVKQGALFTFARNGDAARTQTAVLTASDGLVDDGLGWSVALDDHTVVGGAPERAKRAGIVYTFSRNGEGDRLQTGTVNDDSHEGDQFGWSVALNGPTMVVGAPVRASATVFFTPTPASPPTPPSPVKPDLSKLSVKPHTLHRGAKHARITFTLSVPARVELRLVSVKSGRTVGRRTVAGHLGPNRIRFRLPHKRLAAGRYRLIARPIGGKPHSVAFRVARR